MKRDPKRVLVAGLSDLEAEDERRSHAKLNTRFSDAGPYRRELYPKHVAFFEAGATYRERCLIAANRIGKTDAGAFETALHLTGLYPARGVEGSRLGAGDLPRCQRARPHGGAATGVTCGRPEWPG